MPEHIAMYQDLTKRFGHWRPIPDPVETAIYRWLFWRHGITSAVRWLLWRLVISRVQADFAEIGNRLGRTRRWVCNRLTDDAPLSLNDMSDLALACDVEWHMEVVKGRPDV